jgi:ABC-type transport system substrate-binding protein
MDQWVYPFYHSSGSLNYGSVNDADLDALLVAQRAEGDADAQKALWQQIWDRIHDQVYQMWFPERLQRPAHNNYILNYRTHGWVGTYTCYSGAQGRSIWLDGGQWPS